MRRLLPLLAALPLLGGCDAELNHLLNYEDARQGNAATPASAPGAPRPVASEPVAPPPPAQPATLSPAQSPKEAFCRGVAQNDTRASDFDAATRRAVYARSLAQCLALYGN